MPSFSNTAFANYFKKIFHIDQSSNTGVDGTVRNIQTGDGASSSMWCSDDKFQVSPDDSDSTQAFMVANESGSQILAVDTTNSKVLLGTSPINQQTKEFGVYELSPTAGYHYPLIANNMLTAVSATDFAADNDWGNGTDPATTLDVSGLTRTENAVAVYWPVPAAITLLCLAAMPFFTAILAYLFLKEKISSINGLGGKMVKKLIESNDTEEFQDMSVKFAKYVNVITPKMNQVINLLHKNGIKCGVALFGETIFSLVTKDEKNKVKEILKQFDDGLIITSKIDSSGARLQ